ncbi:MAG: hypothetical protein FJ090_13555, partial [Deltaproteobacteria bacterium]|nr:hypothetical protein [Deltaproteobacteria bacterium]
SCLGTQWDEPKAVCMTDHSVEGRVIDFQASDPVAGADVEAWTSDDINLAASAAAASDENGEWTLALPACTPLSVASEAPGAVTTFRPHVVLEWEHLGRASLDAPSFSTSTVALIAALLGVEWDESTGMIFGQDYDCEGEPVVNAQVFIHDGTGTVVGEPGAYYFDGNSLPSATEPATSGNGGFLLLDVPAGDYTLEVWGWDGSQHIMLAAAPVTTLAGSVTILKQHVGHEDGLVFPKTCFWACDEID